MTSKNSLIAIALALVVCVAQTVSAQEKDATIEPSPNDAQSVNVLDFGAIGDGVADNTKAFQKALDSLGSRGGLVNVPRGQYKFDGSINVPQGVTLRGMWNSVPAHNGCRDMGLPKPTDDGVTFLVVGNAGKEDAKSFITLNTNSVLQGVVIYYPNQISDGEPIPYPWAISMRGKNPAVLDVELLNPFNGIDATENERSLIRNVNGQPLRRGVIVDRIYDIGRIENVHFNPWWSSNPKLLEWQMANGEAFIFERTDWHYVLNTFCFGYRAGYLFRASQYGFCNGNFLGIGADSCHNAVEVIQSAPYGILITNGEFVSMRGDNPTEVVVSEQNEGSVRFSNCSFWGPSEQIARLAGKGAIAFSDCEFVNWDRNKKGNAAIQIIGGSVVVRGCNFHQDQNQVTIAETAKRAIITDNLVKGAVRIDSKCKNVRIEGNLGD